MEHCPDHSGLVQTVGEIKGTVNSIKDSQDVMYLKIDKLISNGAEQKLANVVSHVEDRADSRALGEKIKPIFWIISIVVGYVVLRVAEWSISLIHIGKAGG